MATEQMENIAIVGVSCLMPGAETPDQFWENLIEGRDLRSSATAREMGVNPDVFYAPGKGQADKFYCKSGAFVRGFDFDPGGYGIRPEYLEDLDEVFKWALYVSREALKDSGHLGRPAAVLSRCGLVLGTPSFPTRRTRRYFNALYRRALTPALRALLSDDRFELGALAGDGGSAHNALISGYPAAVVTQALALGGASFAIDAACASSLYAVDLASGYLRSHEADLMLAGAVSCADSLFIHQGFSIFQAYPENGRSWPLDRSSGGLIAAEGAGMFVLKRQSDALRDGDSIYAVIRGVGLSNDGKGKSVLNPNKRGQITAYERAYHAAAIDPGQIDYVECHATGTPVGDPVELDAMADFWNRRDLPRIGSIKSNLGHMLLAAGMGSMLKVILSMERGQIPPTIQVTDPQASSDGAFGPDHIVTTAIAWPDRGDIRRAGVSAFGFGGTNAHLILERETAPQGTLPKAPLPSGVRQPVAIVGMETVFGGCNSLDAFTRTIYRGHRHTTALPARRWRGMETCTGILEHFGLEGAPEGAYISELDIDFLSIKNPPNATDQLIPQQLLMIDVADRAVKDAGLAPGGRVGVIVAMSAELAVHSCLGRFDLSWQVREGLAKAGIDLSPEQIAELEAIAKDSLYTVAQANQYTSFIGNIMAGRIAALWDFSGPAFTISAEENSVPRALEVARMLLGGGGGGGGGSDEVDAVVVGAVDLAGSAESVLVRHRLSPVNQGGRTPGRHRDAEGWTVGEGAGAVVLKLLDRAGDERIYATIDAVSLAGERPARQAGTLPGAPSAAAVLKACGHAFEDAKTAPADVGYLEVAGSGVGEEDAAEMEGLLQAYGSDGSRANCALGSVKANIGHTFNASGMAGLIKAALCLYYRFLPGTPGWSPPGQAARWRDSLFFVPGESRFWFADAERGVRKAAVNVLGRDGNSAHIILSGQTNGHGPDSIHALRPDLFLFPVPGETERALLSGLEQLEKACRSDGLERVSGSCLQSVRKHSAAPFVLALVAGSVDELRNEILKARSEIPRAFKTGRPWVSPGGSYFTPGPVGAKGEVAFVYPGSANAYVGMGRDMWSLFPRTFDLLPGTSARAVGKLYGETLCPRSVERLSAEQLRDCEMRLVSDPTAVFEAGVGFAVLSTRILREEFQLHPRMAFGYSLGESSMLFSLGVWRDFDKAAARMSASPVFSGQLFGPRTILKKAWGLSAKAMAGEDLWSTYVVTVEAERMKAQLDKEPRVYLTMINTAREVIIAGESAGCRRVIERLGCHGVPLDFNGVMHCAAAESIYDAFVKLHTFPAHEVPEIAFYSGVDCAPIKHDTQALAHNISQTVINPVDFPRIVNQVYSDGARVFVDIGPRSTAATWIDNILQDRPHLAVAADRKGMDCYHSLLQVLAKLLSHRVPLDLSKLDRSAATGASGPKSLVKAVTLGGARIEEGISGAHSRFFPLRKPQGGPGGNGHSRLLEAAERSPSPVPGANPVLSSGAALADNILLDEALLQNRSRISRSHAAFLALRTESLGQLGQAIQTQANALLGAQLLPAESCPPRPRVPAQESAGPPPAERVVWNESDLLTFAQGKIADVFGPDYAEIDNYSRRVRLPTPPYLLVSRVTRIQARRGEFKPCAITTEYDIPKNARYSVDGQVPWAVAVESGQCDLLLISYLGIDFQCRGERIYRLLDCTLTFLEELPLEGETLRYDIKINSFSRSGDSLLFFFSYECFVRDTMIMKMDGGCAGFFTDNELAQGKGVIYSAKETAEKLAVEKQVFHPPLACAKIAFSRQDLLRLIHGETAGCFGEAYRQNDRNRSLRLPPEEMLMVDRVVSVDPRGGAWGLGLVVAEKDLSADHWYFPCHFKDDQVLAGSLMGEACSQIMQFYLLYLGLQAHTSDARFMPIPNLAQQVRCRGQVVPADKLLTYRLEVTEIGVSPIPYAKADVEVILEGKVIVHFKDLGMQLLEKPDSDPYRNRGEKLSSGAGQESGGRIVLFGEDKIREFATGSIAKCFGPDFNIYDSKRVSRTPNGDLQLFSRIMEIEARRGEFNPGANLLAEYDVPADPWFYSQNSFPSLPYSMVMEIALQPCGFMSAYLGSTLLYPETDFHFRNLDGRGHLLREVDVRGKTIANRVRLLSSTALEGVIIQKYTYELSCEGEPFFNGDTAFGYFTPDALADQVGLDSGRKSRPWFETENRSGKAVDLGALQTPGKNRPHYCLASGQLHLLDTALVIPEGGRHGAGYVYAQKQVKPEDWFFPCHFKDDPVMPGSLGVEAILQAMQVYALEQDLGRSFISPSFRPLAEHRIIWKYRGQILPLSTNMEVEVHLRRIEHQEKQCILIADASLWKESLRIYELKDAAISIKEAG